MLNNKFIIKLFILIIIILLISICNISLGNSKDNENVSITSTISQDITIKPKEKNIDKKYVALTFDDGPNCKTTKYLVDELNKRNIKATFFVVAAKAIGNEELLKNMIENGHIIGGHGLNHENLNQMSNDSAIKNINSSLEIIKKITEAKVKYYRPPYGNYTNTILEQTNLSFILWNLDTLDWKLRDSKKISDYIIDNVQDGSIVLMHDIYQTSVDAILIAIDELKQENYVFVTIEELARIKNVELKEKQAYRYIK